MVDSSSLAFGPIEGKLTKRLNKGYPTNTCHFSTFPPEGNNQNHRFIGILEACFNLLIPTRLSFGHRITAYVVVFCFIDKRVKRTFKFQSPPFNALKYNNNYCLGIANQDPNHGLNFFLLDNFA